MRSRGRVRANASDDPTRRTTSKDEPRPASGGTSRHGKEPPKVGSAPGKEPPKVGSPPASPSTDRPVAVGLCRCSTDRQDRSIAEQETAIRTWAKEHRTRILRVFKDEGVSGLELSRPGLDALLVFLAASKAKGTVVLWSRDRLVRPEDPIDGLVIERQIRQSGWELRYLTGSNGTGHPLVDAILGLVEHHAGGEYLRKLARDSLRGVIARIKAGDVPGGKIPYAYAKAVLDEHGKTLYVVPRAAKHRKAPTERTRLVPGDPEEVATVRWIFDTYNRGWSSPDSLALALEERGAPRPSTTPWSGVTVRELIRNPVYAGDAVWNRETTARCVRLLQGELSLRLATHPSRRSGRRIAWARNAPDDHLVFRNRHAPLVTREAFDAAQSVITRRSASPQALRTRRALPLTGLITCATCAAHMVGSQHHVRGRVYVYYVCTSERRHRTRAETLEEAVLGALRDQVDKSSAEIVARLAHLLPLCRPTSRRQRALQKTLSTSDRAQRRALFQALVTGLAVRFRRSPASQSRRRFVPSRCELMLALAPENSLTLQPGRTRTS